MSTDITSTSTLITAQHRVLRGGASREYPYRDEASAIVTRCLALFFPHHRRTPLDPSSCATELAELNTLLILAQRAIPAERAEQLTAQFVGELALIQAALLEDAAAIVAGDPAATGVDEVILAYPGFLAIAAYRLAHALYLQGSPLLPRLITEHAHSLTGIDIHPGAVIGPRFCIDHGTGIVIGETANIGARVKMFQGVTLGGLSVTKGLSGKKRHPTIEDDVVIYANATILGGQTVIGARSTIGGNVWLTSSVPADSVVYHRADVEIKSKEAP